ncbi:MULTISPECIES: S-Ena type endospore appendage [Bacillaceae]|uniref:S-Ena type endospore appendage n=1 Tax=Bacillales TaxID=1385 RepID=UPI001883EB84|nr:MULTISPECIES: S-Ena type endospore appendage [Bacillaceae]MBF0708812.1 hypothetical protein [Pseudalkalibacillus hwajinpoensis]MDO6656853.1 hypothetical protein [Anaerobacillus sp. 1_MG-2023]
MSRSKSLFQEDHPLCERRRPHQSKGELVEENICGVFRIDPLLNPYAPIWEAVGDIGPVSGTLSIYYDGGVCEEVEVLIDHCHEPAFYVPEGNTRTRTYQQLCKVTIVARDRRKETGSIQHPHGHKKHSVCTGRYCLTIYYHVKGYKKKSHKKQDCVNKECHGGC